jgi:lysyl-tRNA synthetase class 2
VDLTPPWERLGVSEAFERYAGVLCTGEEDGGVLGERARAAGWVIPAGLTDWDEVFARIFVEAVEPHLGRGRPTLLHRWPARSAALSRLDPLEPAVALRFEVFAGGVELANAFQELTDASEQRRRLVADLEERRARGLPCPPLDERFLGSLAEGLPDVSGIALGVDRLVMLLVGARRIDEVLTFTPEEL